MQIRNKYAKAVFNGDMLAERLRNPERGVKTRSAWLEKLGFFYVHTLSVWSTALSTLDSFPPLK
jgi:hypothetical protein